MDIIRNENEKCWERGLSVRKINSNSKRNSIALLASESTHCTRGEFALSLYPRRECVEKSPSYGRLCLGRSISEVYAFQIFNDTQMTPGEKV